MEVASGGHCPLASEDSPTVVSSDVAIPKSTSEVLLALPFPGMSPFFIPCLSVTVWEVVLFLTLHSPWSVMCFFFLSVPTLTLMSFPGQACHVEWRLLEVAELQVRCRVGQSESEGERLCLSADRVRSLWKTHGRQRAGRVRLVISGVLPRMIRESQ